MKITLCGSIAFYNGMLKTKTNLEKIGHEVELPPSQVEDGDGNQIPASEYYKIRKISSDNDGWVWDRKEWAIRKHFNKIASSDAILVTNYEKNSVKGYVGGNTLMEIGLAFYLKKKIYLLNEIPELSYKEEILGVKPVIINGDLGKII
ncbi:MAG: hypothetical protein ABIB55_02995 [Candidatus Nealsonbacteria bacterium]